MGFKYLILRTKACDVPIIFPDNLCHDVMAALLTKAAEDNPLTQSEPIAAGEIDFYSATCTGSSETLKLQSREEEDDNCVESYRYGVRGRIGQY